MKFHVFGSFIKYMTNSFPEIMKLRVFLYQKKACRTYNFFIHKMTAGFKTI